MPINGVLAKQYLDVSLPLQVLESNAGFYLGTADEDGPCSRESVEYWPAHGAADQALVSGEFTQRETP